VKPAASPFLIACLLAACGAPDAAEDRDETGAAGESAAETAPASVPARGDTTPIPDAGDRPATRLDTLSIEGMPAPLALRLFRTERDFPLPFSAYVPEDMEVRHPGADDARAGAAGADGAAVEFVAAFGGRQRPDASVHIFVFPRGTDRNAAIATARSYTTSRGIPVSRGIEPLGEDDAPTGMPWAVESFRFRYQDGNAWYLGAIGVGERNGRFFQIVRHYPGEMGDGFGPRLGVIMETWRWADGSRLVEPSDRPSN
jgi:hypothetical protein